MTLSTLAKGVLLLALGFTHQAAAACTKSITAKQGDTCATLSSQAGITVTQFLRSNPAVTSCSTLVVGGSYCIEGTADSAPVSSAAPPASTGPSGLKVSSDGACGNGVTCLGSSFGDCCSAHGFCGGSADYCGDGCQAGFGACGGGAVGTTNPPAGSVTVTVTNTVGITRTSVVYQTSTRTEVTTQTRTAATATLTQTVVTLTSISTSVRTSVTSRTVVVTSLEVDTITSIVTSTRVVTSAAGCTQATKTTGIIYTTTQVSGGRPTPTLPGTPSNCRYYDLIQGNDNCRSIANRNGLTLLDFYSLNPSVSGTVLSLGILCTPDLIELLLSGLCQINCDALWEGYYVCVGR
ncbi:carbohydrate-binding module family 18 protein [Staphylotrichum tortipilum]|uniref:Carbohydrate-binding module family 18 protein n=1 Tax=Staphylotrichum tortipilum TaxID=2831512 RepID=A0AAN6RQW8_9PEZI|nr:carbohydrate-binding module family 18 protein [Staphylotrichum longicolle]